MGIERKPEANGTEKENFFNKYADAFYLIMSVLGETLVPVRCHCAYRYNIKQDLYILKSRKEFIVMIEPTYTRQYFPERHTEIDDDGNICYVDYYGYIEIAYIDFRSKRAFRIFEGEDAFKIQREFHDYPPTSLRPDSI